MLEFFEKYGRGKNPIIGDLFEYICALERGNYATLDDYQPEDDGWTLEDEVDVIYKIIEDSLGRLGLEGLDRETLRVKLEADFPIGFPKIANLLTTLHILEQQKQVEPEEEKEALADINAMIYVEAKIPGPCLAYLGALRHASLDSDLKKSLISSLMVSLFKKKEKFGILSHVVHRVAMQDYVELVNQLDEETQKKLSADMKYYQGKANQCFTFTEVKEKSNFVDHCVMLSWERLKNGIGAINLPEVEALVLEEKVEEPIQNKPGF